MLFPQGLSTLLFFFKISFRYPFRQNTDFLYLTGFQEPDAVLVLRKCNVLLMCAVI